MPAKVNISIGGKWHFYEIALAAQEGGYLNHFYTGAYFKNQYVITSPVGRFFNLSNRNNSQIASSKIKFKFYPELLPKLLLTFKLMDEGHALLLRCKMFDNWTKRIIDDCDIFHSQDGFCLETANVCKSRGAKFICDRGIISATYLQTLSETEYAKFGVKKTYADCYLAERTHLEHLLADKLLVPTSTVKNSLIDEGIDGSKIEIIPYGIDLSFFKKLPGTDKRKFRVLFVGELSIRKGCHYLLDAWDKLKLKNAELIIIGNIEKGMEFIFKRYRDNFVHIPYISQAELLEYYSSTDVFILPSLAEGSARVIYEAMACGLPVIYTEMAGSVARDQIDGFQIKSASIDDIADKIAFYYTNRAAAKEMGSMGQEWIKNFSKEKYRLGIINIYKNLLNEA